MTTSVSMTNCPAESFLGATIEEKTRRILGWPDDYTPPAHFAQPPMVLLPKPNSPNSRKEKVARKSSNRALGGSPSPPYPYSLLSTDGRNRKSSTSSNASDPMLKQQLTPPPSPASVSAPQRKSGNAERADYVFGNLPTSPVSPNTPNPYSQQRIPLAGRGVTDSQVFDRLRKLVDRLPTDKNAYQTLVRTVTSVIELEHELQTLKQKTQGVRSILQSRQQQHLAGLQAQPHCRQAAIMNDSMVPTVSALNARGPAYLQPHLPFVGMNEPTVPEDLLGVDVSAFKSLVSDACSLQASPSSSVEVSSVQSPVSVSSGRNEPVSFTDFDLDVFSMQPPPVRDLETLSVDTTSLCC